MPEIASGAAQTIAEMREFASFQPEERRFIIRSLDIAFGRGDAFRAWGGSARDVAAIRGQYLAYRELRSLREAIPSQAGFEGVGLFIGALVRISGQDLALGQITSFGAYRFLYERLLGAAARPYLPAAFCGAAALPQIRPERRRVLLQSLSEAAATAPGWSMREAGFMPERLASEAA